MPMPRPIFRTLCKSVFDSLLCVNKGNEREGTTVCKSRLVLQSPLKNHHLFGSSLKRKHKQPISFQERKEDKRRNKKVFLLEEFGLVEGFVETEEARGLTCTRRMVWPFCNKLSTAHFREFWLLLSLSIATATKPSVPNPPSLSFLFLAIQVSLKDKIYCVCLLGFLVCFLYKILSFVNFLERKKRV